MKHPQVIRKEKYIELIENLKNKNFSRNQIQHFLKWNSKQLTNFIYNHKIKLSRYSNENIKDSQQNFINLIKPYIINSMQYKIASNKKSGEFRETPEVDNLEPSSLNSIKIDEKVQRLTGEELTNKPDTSAGQPCSKEFNEFINNWKKGIYKDFMKIYG